jgi:protein TonB
VITRSSGNAKLDKRAALIVKRAGPFGVVPEDVRAGHDLILISSRFKFTREAGLEASTQTPP